MATNKVQTGATKQVAHSAAVVSGQAVIFGKRVGIALGKYAADELGAYDMEGVFALPKADDQTDIADCVEVFLTPAGNVSLSASGNTSAGYAFAPSGVGVASVDVKINA